MHQQQVFLKVYRPNYYSDEPEYYLLYLNPLQKQINITVDLKPENHCPLAHILWHPVQEVESPGKLNHTAVAYDAVFYRRSVLQNYITVHISRL